MYLTRDSFSLSHDEEIRLLLALGRDGSGDPLIALMRSPAQGDEAVVVAIGGFEGDGQIEVYDTEGNTTFISSE